MDGTETLNDRADDAALAEELSNRFYLGRPGSRVRWAGWGGISRLIAAAVRTRRPPVVVLSLARSGSSWVGSVLGSAPDALYLREPFTQSDPEINRRVVFNPCDHPELEPTLRRLADRAFLGLPDFKDIIVHAPEQWSLRHRPGRRVVVKEVNPRASGWLVARYRPRVILLLRHPAAIAWSSRQKEWLGPTPGDWERRGREDGDSLQTAWEALKDYPACSVVTFESLCADPLTGFRALFDFAGLAWTDEVARGVAHNALGSRRKIDAWRREADPALVQALRRGYDGSASPWFRRDDEW